MSFLFYIFPLRIFMLEFFLLNVKVFRWKIALWYRETDDSELVLLTTTESLFSGDCHTNSLEFFRILSQFFFSNMNIELQTSYDRKCNRGIYLTPSEFNSFNKINSKELPG